MVAALFITFVVCLFVGIPVAFSLGVASLVYFLGTGMPMYPGFYLCRKPYEPGRHIR